METNKEILYKVLWVEDEDSFVIPTRMKAKNDYKIDLVVKKNWEEAETELKDNFSSYSAIILDAFCIIDSKGTANDSFLPVATSNIARICGEKRSYIPWYIYSAGTMEYFGVKIKDLEASRKKFGEDWGEMLYKKTEGSDDKLFQTIVKVAKRQSNNVVQFRHRDVFKYLNSEELINVRAKEYMLKMLGALYFPDENIKYEYEGNPLRKVLEYIFRAAKKQGLLSEYCIDDNERVNVANSARYLCGDTVDLKNNKQGVDVTIHWKEAKDAVFYGEIGWYVKYILGYTNVDSHTTEYIIPKDTDQFFCYVMQLCSIIKAFGKYVNEHPNVEENRSKQVVEPLVAAQSKNGDTDADDGQKRGNQAETPTQKKRKYNTAKDYEGSRWVVEQDGNGVFHCGECYINEVYGQKYLGKSVSLYDVRDGKGRYKFIAKIHADDSLNNFENKSNKKYNQ